jgi:hypothetical protein
LRVVRFRPRRLAGTLAPFSLASFKPMAIACLRLVTLRPEPLLSVPLLRRRIADFTDFDAPLPYFAIDTSRAARGCKSRARIGDNAYTTRVEAL